MSVTAGDLYQSAEKLNSHADCEADWRATCARAYYAVFHEAFAYHEKLAAPGALHCARAGGKHEDLYTRLQNPTIRRSDPDYKLSRRLGYLMQDIHSKRVIADYKPDSEVSEIHAANAMQGARTVLDLIAGHTPPALPARFGTAMVDDGSVDPGPSDLPTPARRGKLKVVK